VDGLWNGVGLIFGGWTWGEVKFIIDRGVYQLKVYKWILLLLVWCLIDLDK
jgi:hypothetical protein